MKEEGLEEDPEEEEEEEEGENLWSCEQEEALVRGGSGTTRKGPC